MLNSKTDSIPEGEISASTHQQLDRNQQKSLGISENMPEHRRSGAIRRTKAAKWGRYHVKQAAKVLELSEELLDIEMIAAEMDIAVGKVREIYHRELMMGRTRWWRKAFPKIEKAMMTNPAMLRLVFPMLFPSLPKMHGKNSITVSETKELEGIQKKIVQIVKVDADNLDDAKAVFDKKKEDPPLGAEQPVFAEQSAIERTDKIRDLLIEDQGKSG